MPIKILYLSDTYAKDVMGTKTSIFTEIKSRGFSIDFANVHSAGRNIIDGAKLLAQLKDGKYTDLWIAHTWVAYKNCSLRDINNLGVRVLGFGFSDPYDWEESKIKNYNIYVTNSLSTKLSIDRKIPCAYFPTACDLRFHQKLDLPKDIDILVFGQGIHERMVPTNYRLLIMQQVFRSFPKRKIAIYGRKWGKFPCASTITGDMFKQIINRSRIALDIQQDHCPLAHRMFECMACGTPVITKSRPEVRHVLQNNVLIYHVGKDLVRTTRAYLNDNKKREDISNIMLQNVQNNHSIKNRIDEFLSWLNSQAVGYTETPK
jgi:hypothetical protein